MSSHLFIRLGKNILDLSFRPHVVGIVNVTPDSFSDGNRYLNPDQCLKHIERLIEEGADIIDLGAESTRPGALPISEKEEIARLQPVLKKYTQYFDIPLSIDTTKSAIADLSLSLGASIINDISGFQKDPLMPKVIAKYQAAVVIMHSQGTPQIMQNNPQYSNIMDEVKLYFQKAIAIARTEGIQSVIIDPGIGFGKTASHNLVLLNRIDHFAQLGCPMMIGVSRKSVIGHVSNASVEDRLPGTIAANVAAFLKGACLFRVHDVEQNVQALQVAKAIRDGGIAT